MSDAITTELTSAPNAAAENDLLWEQYRAEQLSGDAVPEDDAAVLTSRHDPRTVVRVHGAPDIRRVPHGGFADRFPAGEVEDHQLAAETGDGGMTAVR